MARAPINPQDARDLLALAEQMNATTGRGRGQLIRSFLAQHPGWTNEQAVYKGLKGVGWESGRKRRADAGTTRVSDALVDFVAASKRQGMKANGIGIQPTPVALNIAAANGMEVPVSVSTVNRVLRDRRMDNKSQAQARNHQHMRYEHPNSDHQIDPSLCVVYYVGGRQVIMEAEKFYKNKPDALCKVLFKTWRYVRWDGYSSTVDVRYYQAAGETQENLFEFLLYTWGRQPGRLSYGVPKRLYWDKGSANMAHGVRRFLNAMGVAWEAHATHHAWAKGGVEGGGNRLVEMQFESRLRTEPVNSIEELNAAAAAWQRDYSANALAHIDARVRRDDGQRYVRDDLWNHIAQVPGALVELPSREVCERFLRGRDETRQIRDNRITFVHPRSGQKETYDLTGYADHYSNGDKVEVSPLLLGDCVLNVKFAPAMGRAPVQADVAPLREFDSAGRAMANTLFAHERRTAPLTLAGKAAQHLAGVTWGEGTTLDEAEKRKQKGDRPFGHMNDGRGLIAHSHMGKKELPTRLLPAASTDLADRLAAQRPEMAERKLSYFEAAAELARRGLEMTPERNAQVRAWYPDGGVPEAELEDLQRRLTVRATLRVVGGDAP